MLMLKSVNQLLSVSYIAKRESTVHSNLKTRSKHVRSNVSSPHGYTTQIGNSFPGQ